MSAAHDSATVISRLLHGHSFAYSNEAALQRAIEVVLRSNGYDFDREVELGGAANRIDFLTRERLGWRNCCSRFVPEGRAR